MEDQREEREERWRRSKVSCLPRRKAGPDHSADIKLIFCMSSHPTLVTLPLGPRTLILLCIKLPTEILPLYFGAQNRETFWSACTLSSCLTLCNSMDCSPPGSSVHGILQPRILEWVAISFSRDLLKEYFLIQLDLQLQAGKQFKGRCVCQALGTWWGAAPTLPWDSKGSFFKAKLRWKSGHPSVILWGKSENAFFWLTEMWFHASMANDKL